MQKKNKLVVLCGCSGSGKSTWIKNHLASFDGYTAVISRDEIRFRMVRPDEEYFSREKEVFAKFIEDIQDSMTVADNVIVDATHINQGSRSKLLRNIGASLKGWEVDIVVIKVSLDTALIQNQNRIDTRAYVPEMAIRNMYNSFRLPSFEEGFDKIYIYRPDVTGTKYTIFEKEEN